MRVIPIRPVVPHPVPSDRPALRDLRRLLLGHEGTDAIPDPFDLMHALCALAEGTRRKSLLPLASAPAELVLVRRGEQALVSYYVTDAALEVRQLDRPIALRTLIAECAIALETIAERSADPSVRELAARSVARASTLEWASEVSEVAALARSGGAIERPLARVPLAFGFEAQIGAMTDPPRQSGSHSDVHALLFPGSLWAWARGRRIRLARGPIMLAVQRMVAAVRALIEAHEAGRSAHVRLRAAGFVVGMRLERARVDRAAEVMLSFGSDEETSVTVPALTPNEAALPILRLATDVIRALISVDRAQARNLRVSTLREQVRSLRRRLGAVTRPTSQIVNDDPDRLRASASPPEPLPIPTASPRALRFVPRWEAEVEGLDAASTFLCGERIVVATPRSTVAIDRDDGRVVWSHRRSTSASFMTGRALVQLALDGQVSLCDVADGEPYAEAKVAPRVSGAACALLAGGGNVPPIAVIAEGRDRLVAVDLRNGELRWRVKVPSGPASLSRAGRVLLIVAGDGTLSALDSADGELAWRAAERVVQPPAVRGDTVLLACGGQSPGLHAIDLFSGASRWRHDLEEPPCSAPVWAGEFALIGVGERRRAAVAAFDPDDGRLRWMTPDVGIAQGASCLAVDRMLLVHAPNGRLSALSGEDGTLRWSRTLAHPIADDVPRRLELVLRGGALFVPSARVHVLRPHDGTSIGDPLAVDLVPDWMRVDERGWVYVAEESGLLCAMAPAPALTLVR